MSSEEKLPTQQWIKPSGMGGVVWDFYLNKEHVGRVRRVKARRNGHRTCEYEAIYIGSRTRTVTRPSMKAAKAWVLNRALVDRFCI